MRIIASSDRKGIAAVLARSQSTDPAIERTAARIVSDVRAGGDRALRRWMAQLDDVRGRFEVTRREWHAGWAATPPPVRRAIRTAVRHIRQVAERQLPRPFRVDVRPGVTVEQRVQALARVGCYVPGGRYPLPSTLLMTAVPARVAGVRDIVVACPRPAPAVLCAAVEAGATQVLRIGGAQAIAALAYGTDSIPPVNKIVGPGNAWVAAAKAIVSADCPIDFQAGPSEIVVCADRGRPDWIAADLIAQAEHDPAARAIFVTTRRSLAKQVAEAVERRMPDQGPASASLRANGAIVVAGTRAEAIDLVNRLGPEHLVCDRAADVARFHAAGTIFVGEWSAQASGDYCTGSNHVLPTGGAARFRGGLSAADFVRVYTVQTLTRQGLAAIAPSVIALAEAEGLRGHAESIRVRVGSEVPRFRGSEVRAALNPGIRAPKDPRAPKEPRNFGTPEGLWRRATINRQTTETHIRLTLDLDGRGRYDVRTGIRFLDHMLELVARHGGFNLTIAAKGDLDVDAHHTVEDVGIALGNAVATALGPKRGIHRAGYFIMPMDETLAIAAIDLSGRPFAVVDLKLGVKNVGDLPAELVQDFFEGFAGAARANVHLKVLYGRSSHHQIEAVFKAFARALRAACSKDRRLRAMLPSTKGLL